MEAAEEGVRGDRGRLDHVIEGDMNRNCIGRMGRRTFLRLAGGVAGTWLAGSGTSARHLLLVDATDAERISRVEWIVYDTGLRGPQDASQARCAVRITTTHGAQGWADVGDWAAPADDDTAQGISDALLGRSLAEHDNLWRQLYEQGLPLATLGAVDTALWDLRGRIAGKPVHALLGTARSAAEARVSTGFNLGEPSAYAEFAVACRDKGIQAIRIQPYVTYDDATGRATAFPDRDMAVFSAVREAAGPDYTCMADHEGAYTYDQALRVGRLLDDLNYTWYGSPMPETDDWLDRYATLASELRTPICAPRSDSDAYQSRLRWIDRRACDVCRIGVHLGGLTACLQLAGACREAGIAMDLLGAGPDAYPHLQLIGATDESLIRHFEVASPSNESRTLPGRLTPEPRFDAEGRILIPQTPGLGLELDWTYITTHRIA